MDSHTLSQDSPSAHGLAYFDTAAASAPPQGVIRAVENYLERTQRDGPYLPAFRQETYQALESIRAKAAAFLNAQPQEIAFVKNTTEGICVVAQGIDWRAGDEVIVPDTEILSNLAPWLRLQAVRGIKVVRVLAGPDGRIDPATVQQALTPRTRLITFSSLINSTGALQPVAELCALAASHGAMSLVNAAQSMGLMPNDVQAWQCDFLSACTRKGLRAIEGGALLYVRASRIESLEPCLVGWWNSSIDADTQELTLPSTAKRFEAGCPNVPAVLALGAAIDHANAIGLTAIEARVRALTHYAIGQLGSLPGFTLYGPQDTAHRIGIVPFNVVGVSPHALVEALARGGVVIEAGHFMAHAVMRRFGIAAMARLSLHYFNTEAQIDQCRSLIAQAIHPN
jgi:cysteine desulfurase / selenocysteine lyase